MLTFHVKHDFDRVRNYLGGLANEVPRAAARALNDTGFAVRRALQEEMRRVFDRPTPWALNAYIVRKATPTRLTALVSAQETAAKSVRALAFLGPQIEGGPRLAKRSERRLRQAGVLGPGEFIVPGAGADIDERSGNVRPSQIQKILSQLYAFSDTGANVRIGRKVEYFHKTIKGVRAIWRRRPAGTIVPALMIVRQPQYRARFAARAVAERTATAVWPVEFNRQVSGAIRRA